MAIESYCLKIAYINLSNFWTFAMIQYCLLNIVIFLYTVL